MEIETKQWYFWTFAIILSGVRSESLILLWITENRNKCYPVTIDSIIVLCTYTKKYSKFDTGSNQGQPNQMSKYVVHVQTRLECLFLIGSIFTATSLETRLWQSNQSEKLLLNKLLIEGDVQINISKCVCTSKKGKCW
jgi:hypothetical protein